MESDVLGCSGNDSLRVSGRLCPAEGEFELGKPLDNITSGRSNGVTVRFEVKLQLCNQIVM